MPKWKSHGTGLDYEGKIGSVGKNVVIENGAKIFFPENIELGDDVYIGHDTILKAYFDKKLKIGAGTWVGPQCFIYASGGITIGRNVGIGPGVKIMSSAHQTGPLPGPILHRPIEHASVCLDDGSDIGAGSIILMGVHVGKEVQIGAGAVVNRDIPDRATAVGIPARILNTKPEVAV
ncbi:MAG: acyltransferase [candidate division Zixibacteria bacterium]|nr:acyltransferase [candidate division Zixibacteria bacterium]